MDKLFIIKIGGNIIDDEEKLSSFLNAFASIEHGRVLIHGGGKLATKLAEQLNIPQQLIDGRRITDAETLKIVTMVYAGYINKNIVALLQANGCNALGLTGADGNLILAHKRMNSTTDYGYAGDLDEINSDLLSTLLHQNFTPVIAPITHDAKGQLLNTNADTIANEIAIAMSAEFEAHLIYIFEKRGVLLDVNDESSVIKNLTKVTYSRLKAEGAIHSGMIPKLDNAFAALNSGVKKVIIGQAENFLQLINGTSGTSIVHD